MVSRIADSLCYLSPARSIPATASGRASPEDLALRSYHCWSINSTSIPAPESLKFVSGSKNIFCFHLSLPENRCIWGLQYLPSTSNGFTSENKLTLIKQKVNCLIKMLLIKMKVWEQLNRGLDYTWQDLFSAASVSYRTRCLLLPTLLPFRSLKPWSLPFLQIGSLLSTFSSSNLATVHILKVIFLFPSLDAHSLLSTFLPH